jgi:hypothetical protein
VLKSQKDPSIKTKLLNGKQILKLVPLIEFISEIVRDKRIMSTYYWKLWAQSIQRKQHIQIGSIKTILYIFWICEISEFGPPFEIKDSPIDAPLLSKALIVP